MRVFLGITGASGAPYAARLLESLAAAGRGVGLCASRARLALGVSCAIKEGGKLILCPRETPLSTIHLENMLRVRQAGATVLFLAPGFYHGASSVDDLLDFVVARCLPHLRLRHQLVRRWGAGQL